MLKKVAGIDGVQQHLDGPSDKASSWSAGVNSLWEGAGDTSWPL